MDLRIEGKRALVTGASSGIGAETARTLAREGAVVVVNGRDRARTEQTAREIEQAGGKAVVAIGDLTRDEDADAVAAVAHDALGGIDILVNNAGGANSDPRRWNEIPLSEFFDSYNLNVIAGLRLIHHFAPAMVERGWGRIINISSAVGRQAMNAMHDYGAAKMALENLSLNLSMDLARNGVTVNTVIPGMILTPTAHGFLDELRDHFGWPDDPAEIQRRYTLEVAPQPVPRFGDPSEIAAAIAFLASPVSDYTTGAVLRVDGGMTRGL
jgi:NAD(P)-dependent dehydrogenase (short-subunit alcohol dehydrogenase family)